MMRYHTRVYKDTEGRVIGHFVSLDGDLWMPAISTADIPKVLNQDNDIVTHITRSLPKEDE